MLHNNFEDLYENNEYFKEILLNSIENGFIVGITNQIFKVLKKTFANSTKDGFYIDD